MPSLLELPRISDLLTDFSDAVTGQRDENANMRRGGRHDHFAGEGAILFSREAQRDRDLFRAIYFDYADGDDLTNYVEARYGISRILDAQGLGTAVFTRPTAGGGAGTFWTGTTIMVVPFGGMTAPKFYEVSADTPIASGALGAMVPIKAQDFGSGHAVNVSGTGVALFVDPTWDSTWTVAAVNCADGTDFEQAPDYRARVRQTLLNDRSGYEVAIITACQNAGATFVVLFASNFAGDASDLGYSVCYVGDQNFASTPSLITACSIALEGFRVCGADLQVLGMQSQALFPAATVTLWDDPGAFDTVDLQDALSARLVAEFTGTGKGYSYGLDELAGAMQSESDAIQQVAFTTPSLDAPLMQTLGGIPNFPAVLTRYTVQQGNVQLTFQGPPGS